ncbi:MAG TPA: class IV adenylate cyclase, partial [Candidatus Saccharimonadales bacterium]|nr:class IV adenylate cyclase [Candidatus Saccharimonadales bacterium]
MREIEVKATITDRQAIITAITNNGGKVSEPVSQHDRVYGLPDEAGIDYNTAPWLRIRSETKGDTTKHYFTLKKSITNQMDSIEHETEVADDNELEKIIVHMDFVPYSDLTKTRQKARIGDIEICIDQVDQLGDFVEAEKMTADDADYQAVVDELWTVLE